MGKGRERWDSGWDGELWMVRTEAMIPWLVYVYSAVGLGFGIAYVLRRLPRPASLGLRMILLPGAFALWPYLLSREWSLRK